MEVVLLIIVLVLQLIIIIHLRNHSSSYNSNHKLNLILKNQNKIMATQQNLNDKIDELQASVDAKQEQIAAAIAAFEQTIADLTAQLGTGMTSDQIQAAIDKLDSAKQDLEATPTA